MSSMNKVRVVVRFLPDHRTLRIDVSEARPVKEIVAELVQRLDLPLFDSDTRRRWQYVATLHNHTEQLPETTLVRDLPIEAGERHALVTRIGSESPFGKTTSALASFSIVGGCALHELEELLRDIRVAYEAILASEALALDPHGESRRYHHHLREMHDAVAENLRPAERLILKRIVINSPGLLEVIGRLNPLETIRQFLDDRRRATLAERAFDKAQREDEQFRNPIEQAKAVLEVESMKTRVATERAKLLADIGFSQDELRPYIVEVISQPLDRLQVHQASGRLECNSVTPLDEIEVDIIDDTLAHENLLPLST